MAWGGPQSQRLAFVQTFRKCEQGARSSAAAIQHHHRKLFGRRALHRHMVERNDRGHRCAKVPLHLLARVVEAGVVTVQDQVYLTRLKANQAFELVQSSAGVPEPHQVCATHQ